MAGDLGRAVSSALLVADAVHETGPREAIGLDRRGRVRHVLDRPPELPQQARPSGVRLAISDQPKDSSTRSPASLAAPGSAVIGLAITSGAALRTYTSLRRRRSQSSSAGSGSEWRLDRHLPNSSQLRVERGSEPRLRAAREGDQLTGALLWARVEASWPSAKPAGMASGFGESTAVVGGEADGLLTDSPTGAVPSSG